MRYGLLGRTLGHSFSAELHALFGNREYGYFEIEPEKLEMFIRSECFDGLNVTVPYKKAVIPFLDSLSAEAREIGAVNTVVRQNGKLVGYNTDCFGLQRSITANGQTLCGKCVAILGSGGTSQTAEYVSKKMNASSVFVVSRTPRDGMISYEDLYKKAKLVDVVLNTTPCGMFPDSDGVPVVLSGFPSLSFVCDAVYNPLRTRLVSEAMQRKIAAFGGLYMLVAQAAEAERIFFNKTFSDADIFTVYKTVLRQKENIVLIGMPSCGKTTLGRMLAKQTNRPFIDTDELFFRTYGNTAAEEILQNGEASFREKESAVVKTISSKTGCVIATGGGTVLKHENMLRLKQNGRIVLLDRPPEKLTPSVGRPLTQSYEDMARLYEKRIEIYKGAADVTVKNDGTVREALRKLCDEVK